MTHGSLSAVMSVSTLASAVQLLAEGVRVARGQPALSALVSAITLAVCSLTLGTTGQTISAERAVLVRMDEGGTRTVIVVDQTGTAGIPTAAVERIEHLSGVSWALGIRRTIDVHTGSVPNGQRVPTRVVHDNSPDLDAPRSV